MLTTTQRALLIELVAAELAVLWDAALAAGATPTEVDAELAHRCRALQEGTR